MKTLSRRFLSWPKNVCSACRKSLSRWANSATKYIFKEKTSPFHRWLLHGEIAALAEQNLVKKITHTIVELPKKSYFTPTRSCYLFNSIHRSPANIKKRGRTFEKNMSNDYLRKLNRAYNQWRKTSALPVHFPLNGDITTEKSVLYDFLMLFGFLLTLVKIPTNCLP